MIEGIDQEIRPWTYLLTYLLPSYMIVLLSYDLYYDTKVRRYLRRYEGYLSFPY